jgi:hypothetical protein
LKVIRGFEHRGVLDGVQEQVERIIYTREGLRY